MPGQVYTDDDTIANDCLLLRRVIINEPGWVTEKNGQLRPSSCAFSDDPEDGSPMSVTFQERVI